MSTSAVSGTSAFAGALGSTEDRVPLKTLGQDEFLKLLVTQLANQDPLQPQSDMEFIGQMASFTTLEQTRAMVTDLAQLRTDQEILKANALIGRTVEIYTNDDSRWYGTVTAVQVEEGTPKVVVGGQLYDLSQLRTISTPAGPA
jgi:flagellar basal-body rod modification protein FlgD